ncbi:MAG: hypothetical protein EOO04_22780 [Chitinophagaceae bacterium]|nr:MAG: hypothetical protein EOO04_22780 [Chitinophagaceae bacterium]
MKAPVLTRIWYALMAAILWTGIYLTGFSLVSWLLYLPAVGLTVSSIIGVCPTVLIAAKLLGTKGPGKPKP